MEEELVKVENLNPRSRRVNILVKVVEKSDPREVISRRDGSTHKVAEALVGDETGVILLTLWDQHVEQVNVGNNLKISNAYVSLFKGSMRLNIGRYGSFEIVDEEVPEVNTENNVSTRRYTTPRRRPPFGGGPRTPRKRGRERERRR